MTTKQLESHILKNSIRPYLVRFGDFAYQLFVDYDDDNRLKIFICSFYDDSDIIETDVAFAKTETAIAHIKKELKRVANDILKSLKSSSEVGYE